MDNKFKKIQLVLSAEQQERYEELYRRVQSRSPHVEVPLSVIVKTIVGFEQPNALITQKDLDYFVGKSPRSIHAIEDLGTATTALEGKTISRSKPKKKVVNGD